MGLKQQLEQFLTLTTLLNEEEATGIHDLTMAEPRPDNFFNQAKKPPIFARHDRSIHER